MLKIKHIWLLNLFAINFIYPQNALGSNNSFELYPATTGPGKTKGNTYLVMMEHESVPTWFKREFPNETFNARDFRGLSYGEAVLDSNLEVLADNGVNHERVLSNLCFASALVTARLSAEEANALQKDPRVRAVVKDTLNEIETDSSPGFLGLRRPSSPWAAGVLGEDVVIGVLDTGIYPEHPSFADRMVDVDITGNSSGDSSDESRPYPPPPASWNGDGTCQFGNRDYNPDDAPFNCNNKLLAARFYVDGFLSGGSIVADEFLSARDASDHGSHVTSTAAGNFGVSATIGETNLGKISGIAPRARISVYKVCWRAPLSPTFTCANSDIIDAIDQAIADGVDVINFSVGGGSTVFGPQEQAWLSAADAGIWVATSQGNSGPGAATVGTPAGVPWITSVGNMIDDGVMNGRLANMIANGSSRGPNLGAPDIIKPDIVAPGTVILAAGSPFTASGPDDGELFTLISGTSMASPHVAGAFALIHQVNPDWSPAMARSAIMTTARQGLLKADRSNADPFDVGSGLLNPNRAFRPNAGVFRPGLVYDARMEDYLSFTCANNEPFILPPRCQRLRNRGFPSDGSQLNYPSIGVSRLFARKTVQRTVTSVMADRQTFEAVLEAPDGLDVEVTPSRLTLEPGESATYSVSFKTGSDPDLNNFAFGSVTWANENAQVRSPIAVRPIGVIAPEEIDLTGTQGRTDFDIRFGYQGVYRATLQGFIPPDGTPATVTDDPGDQFNPINGQGLRGFRAEFSENTLFARFRLLNELTDGNDDLDLWVLECGPPPDNDCVLNPNDVLSSTNANSNEAVSIRTPLSRQEGFYLIFVHGFETDGPDSNFTLLSWVLDPTDNGGNFTVQAPREAVFDSTRPATVSWPGATALEDNQLYIGAISHSNEDKRLDLTVLDLDTR